MAQELFQYCEEYSKLYPGQIKGREKRLAIDAVATQVHTIQKK